MSRLYGWCRSSNMNEKDHIVPSRVTKGGNQKTSWDDYEYGWIWLNMLLVGNQWSEQPKNVRFVPNTKTLSEWYFWSGQSVKSVSYIQDSKGSLHCMEINSPFKGSIHFPSSFQQDGLFQVLQINTRFCFNCWSVINALARLSTLTSASRAAHLTWVEDRLSAHLCPPLPTGRTIVLGVGATTSIGPPPFLWLTTLWLFCFSYYHCSTKKRCLNWRLQSNTYKMIFAGTW